MGEVRTIPQRELRNDISRILREVEQGEAFHVTVNGRVVAALIPPPEAGTVRPRRFVPWHEVVHVFRDLTPFDEDMERDIREGIGDDTFHDPWTRSSTPPS